MKGNRLILKPQQRLKCEKHYVLTEPTEEVKRLDRVLSMI